ncbi:MAG TPA: type I secretion C-terminal target domain-containing protein, partial [Candidatus Moranbacteria bacterium]|nr:type I secretion C-terminal target domain-containing protein [Candidatus Moranbacteria bacterium]
MDNKIDLNDLLREKRELDSFLSTIAKDQASPSVPVKETVQTKESSSPSVSENKSVLKDSDRAAGLTIEKPGIMPEDLFKPTAG